MASPARKGGDSPGRSLGARDGETRSPGRVAAALHHGTMHGMRFSSPELRAKLERRARAARRAQPAPRALMMEEEAESDAGSMSLAPSTAGRAGELGTATRWSMRFPSPPAWAAPAVVACGGSLVGVGSAVSALDAATAVSAGMARFACSLSPQGNEVAFSLSPSSALAAAMIAASSCVVFPSVAWSQSTLERTAGAASRLNQRVAAEWRKRAALLAKQRAVSKGLHKASSSGHSSGRRAASPKRTVAGTSSMARSMDSTRAAIMPSAVEIMSATAGTAGTARSKALSGSRHLDKAERQLVTRFLASRRNSRSSAPTTSTGEAAESGVEVPVAVGTKRRTAHDGGAEPKAMDSVLVKAPRLDVGEAGDRGKSLHRHGNASAIGHGVDDMDGDGEPPHDSDDDGSVRAGAPIGSPATRADSPVAAWQHDLADAAVRSDWWGDELNADVAPDVSTALPTVRGLVAAASARTAAPLLTDPTLPQLRLPRWWPGASVDPATGAGAGSRAAVAFLGGGALITPAPPSMPPVSTLETPSQLGVAAVGLAPTGAQPTSLTASGHVVTSRSFGLAALGAQRTAVVTPGTVNAGAAAAAQLSSTTDVLGDRAATVDSGEAPSPRAVAELPAGEAESISDWTSRCLQWQQAFTTAVHGLMAVDGLHAAAAQVVIRFPGSAPGAADRSSCSPWDGGNAVILAWCASSGDGPAASAWPTASTELMAVVARSSKALRMGLRDWGVPICTPLSPTVALADLHADADTVIAAVEAVESGGTAGRHAGDVISLAPSLRAMARTARAVASTVEHSVTLAGTASLPSLSKAAAAAAAAAGTPASSASLLVVRGTAAVLALGRALQASHMPTLAASSQRTHRSPSAVPIPASLWCVDIGSTASISSRCRHWDVPQIVCRGVAMVGGSLRHATFTSAVVVHTAASAPAPVPAVTATDSSPAPNVMYELTASGVVLMASIRRWASELTAAGGELRIEREAGQARCMEVVG